MLHIWTIEEQKKRVKRSMEPLVLASKGNIVLIFYKHNSWISQDNLNYVEDNNYFVMDKLKHLNVHLP
jgi:hypothetical protein